MDVRGWCLGSLALLGMEIVGPGGVAAQVVNPGRILDPYLLHLQHPHLRP